MSKSEVPHRRAPGTWVFLLFGIGVLAGIPDRAKATDVSGSLALAGAGAQAAQGSRAYYWDEPNGALPPRTRSVRAHNELCVVVVGKGKVEPVSYLFQGGTLAPSTLAFRSGSKASLINTDIFSHQLYSPDIKDVEPHATAPGNRRKLLLGNVGVFELRDQMHPTLRGHAHVIADLLQQVPISPSGAFSFEIEPGTYTLRVLRGKDVVAEQRLKISGKKKALGRIKLKAKGK